MKPSSLKKMLVFPQINMLWESAGSVTEAENLISVCIRLHSVDLLDSIYCLVSSSERLWEWLLLLYSNTTWKNGAPDGQVSLNTPK